MAQQGESDFQRSYNQDSPRSGYNDRRSWSGSDSQRPNSREYNRSYSGGKEPRQHSGRHSGRPLNRNAEEHDREPSPDRMGFDQFDNAGHWEGGGHTDNRNDWQNRGSPRGNRGYQNRNSYNRGGGRRNHDFAEGFQGESSNQYNGPVDQFPVGQWGSGPEAAERNYNNKRQNRQQFGGQNQNYGRPESREKSAKQRKTMEEVQDVQEGPIWHLTKNLSYFLRHGFEKDGYTLMDGGYMYIEDLLEIPLFRKYSEEDVRLVTKTDPIGRFTIKEGNNDDSRPMVKANFLQTRDTANPMIHLSKTLSYLLRHGAEKHGFILMPGGYLYVDEVLQYEGLTKYTEQDVKYVVETNSKKRFALSEEERTHRLMVKANQGHSVQVEGLDLRPIASVDEAPVIIHGTYLFTWEIIKQQGLSKMGRNHIHFAVGEPDDDGVISGMRKSAEVLIYIDLAKCLKDGIKFYRSSNDVILSEGNEDGFIYPCYFKFALNRKPRHMLQFDNTIAQKVTTIVGGESLVDALDGKKKKKKKKKKGDREQAEDRWRDNVAQNIESLKVTDDNGVMDATDGTGSVPVQREESSMEEVVEHIKFTDIEECQNAVSFLTNCRDPVAVWCFGNQLGESGGTISTIVCIAQNKAYFFDLSTNLDLVEKGQLGNYFNSRDTSVKVFHRCAKASYTLFRQCNIVLDGTNVYDTAVAYDNAKENGVGNLSELDGIAFKPNLWENVTSVMEGKVIETCNIMVQAYDIFSRWFHKPPKKEIFEEVMSLLDKNDVKAAREKRKKEQKQQQQQQQQQQQHKKSGKGKR